MGEHYNRYFAKLWCLFSDEVGTLQTLPVSTDAMDGWAFIRNIRSRFGTQFVGRYDKAIGLAMMVGLIIFSTADMVADWCNYAQLTDDGATYALVTGRPPPVALSVRRCMARRGSGNK